MADEVVPLYLKNTFGGGFYRYQSSDPTHCAMNIWSLTSKNAVKFLQTILPYLKLKYKQALIGIEFSKTMYPVGRLTKMGHFIPFPKSVLETRMKLMRKIQHYNQTKTGGREHVIY